MDGVSAGEDGHAFWKFSEITHIFHWKKLIEDRIKPNFFLPCWRVPPIVSISKFFYPLFFCTKSCGKFGNLGQRSPFQFFHSSFGHLPVSPLPSGNSLWHSRHLLWEKTFHFATIFWCEFWYLLLYFGKMLILKNAICWPKNTQKKAKRIWYQGKIWVLIGAKKRNFSSWKKLLAKNEKIF